MKQLISILLKAVLASTVSLLALGCASNSHDMSDTKSDVHMEAGTESIVRKDYTKALRQLSEAAKLKPKSPEIWSNIGVAYVGKNELARAEDAWKKALKLDPTFQDARLNLGILYTRQRRFPEAEKFLLEATKDLTYEKLHQVAYRLALVYLELKRPLLAEQQLKVSVRENGAYCPAWFQLGMIQRERGDYKESAESLRGSVMGTCFKNPEAHYEIGQLYLKANEVALAKTKFLEVIQLFPSSEWAKRSEATLNMIR